jgi:N-glycosidase YbiA
MIIDSFSGEYEFLSNFYPCEIILDRIKYPSIEHAFQAKKAVDKESRYLILQCETPGKAKKMGRKIKIRDDWESIKIGVMIKFLRQKFAYPELKEKLINTGDAELVEGNWWNDIFWGVCNGVGENHLGKCLMQIRDEIKNGKSL